MNAEICRDAQFGRLYVYKLASLRFKNHIHFPDQSIINCFLINFIYLCTHIFKKQVKQKALKLNGS